MKASYLFFILSCVGYILLAYCVPRTDFIPFSVIYTGLFIAYGCFSYNLNQWYQKQYWSYYLAAALLLRVIFLWAVPELSDDFWRYLWDGRLLTHGMNPYQFVPEELLTHPIYEQAHLSQLFAPLNSPKFYSVYPPVTQAFFSLATVFFPDNVFGSIVVLHLLNVLLEAGTIVLLAKLLEVLGKPKSWALLYAFNPLVIIELTGNLHTEGIMIFFIIAALYCLFKEQDIASAICFAMAVGAKLLPLMFMPLILHRLWLKRGVIYCAIVGIINLSLFVLFFDLELLLKIRESMGLYFAHFEFNASVYYFVRYGVINEYWRLWDYHAYFKGFSPLENLLHYDLYVLLRKLLPIMDIAIIVYWSTRKAVKDSKQKFLTAMLLIYSTHFFLATTIHPWYITPLVLFTALTKYRYALIWTSLIGFTYISYKVGGFEEHSGIIAVEYLVVFAYLYYEYRKQRVIAELS